MSKPPYPPFPPNYTSVLQTGGRQRAAFVVELRCLDELDDVRKTAIKEWLELKMSEFLTRNVDIEQAIVADDTQFDAPTRKALRLE